jgi:hypothetical protein
MQATQFAYWLQGMFELGDVKTLDEEQVKKIKNHLKLVFIYDIDPSHSDNDVVQKIMQNLHDGNEPLEGVSAKLNNATAQSLINSAREREANMIAKC